MPHIVFACNTPGIDGANGWAGTQILATSLITKRLDPEFAGISLAWAIKLERKLGRGWAGFRTVNLMRKLFS